LSDFLAIITRLEEKNNSYSLRENTKNISMRKRSLKIEKKDAPKAFLEGTRTDISRMLWCGIQPEKRGFPF